MKRRNFLKVAVAAIASLSAPRAQIEQAEPPTHVLYAKWNGLGEEWRSVDGRNNWVKTRDAWDAELYAGGSTSFASGIVCDRISVWNGSAFEDGPT